MPSPPSPSLSSLRRLLALALLLAGAAAVTESAQLGEGEQELLLPPEGFHSVGDSVFAALGSHHTCALEYRPGVDFGGSARCWGRNQWGEASPPLDSTFIQISAGERHTCGLQVDQTLACWGKSYMASPPEGFYQQITSGVSHACALTLDGLARCWGDSMHQKIAAPEDVKFLSLSAGGSFTCGLRWDNTAQCWGHNHVGQAAPPTEKKFRQIAASNTDHACGITLNDAADIVCWGRNMRGEGDARKGPWAQISAGHWSTCGIREGSGVAECWGLMSEAPDGTGPFEEITSAWYHTCGVKEDGELVCWGTNSGWGGEVIPDGFELA